MARQSATDPPAARRRKVGRAVVLWAGTTLGAVVLIAALTIWHLMRRGRLLRERLGPPKKVELPESGSV